MISRPKRHPDDTWVDHIEMDTEPRWKTSGLSGDEWRFSYAVRVYRKKHLLAFETFGSAAYAAHYIMKVALSACPAEFPWPDKEDGGPYGEQKYCFNPGCPNVATWRHDIKQEWDNGNKVEHSWESYRLFCDEHQERGDCDLEDCDGNYVVSELALVGT